MLVMLPEEKKIGSTQSLLHLRETGFALVSGIFILVVLGLLGAAMLTLSSVQHTTSVQDIQGTRAYFAARGGIEWGIYQVLRVPPPPAAAPDCPAANLVLGDPGNPFTVVVQCTATNAVEAGNPIKTYQITSTASQGAPGGLNFVQRQLRASVSR